MTTDAVLHALAEPQRRRILAVVRDRELPAGEIARQFDITPQAVSQHLRVLNDAGVLRERRDGTRRLYALRPEALEPALLRAVAFVKGTANLFVDWMRDYARHENALPPDDQAKCQRAGGDANIFYLQSRWRLAPDEALLVEARELPRCSAWKFQLSNFWMESLEWRDRRVSLNNHQAAREPDGKTVRIVVAARDPGHPNWIDTAGHAEGLMSLRWARNPTLPEVRSRVVALDAL